MSHQNAAFDAGESQTQTGLNGSFANETNGKPIKDATAEDRAVTTASTANASTPERENWGKGIEFLMSCIAMSVGLGNVWRFPFTALDNGGGAFLIPYLIVLVFVGRPLYYLEMIIGQFSSRSSVKVFNIAPAMRGTGVGQVIAVFILCTYYASIMALIGRYLYDSFQSPLPWSLCKPSWTNCIDSSGNISLALQYAVNTQRFSPFVSNETGQILRSSSELYFRKEVLQELSTIHYGIGGPILNLALFLAFAWVCIALVLIKGIKSSGKASYFLALFPYVIIGILLIRAVTLPGAWNGILFFIRPQWDKILEPSVWYAAVTQCFFSLAVCFGNIIMYSSFNKFNHNVYRDANIVTGLDTFTSLLAGFTIFGILGHLAHEIGITDISNVVNGGPGLAFISYPEAIARFQFAPQVFSVLFFFMLFVLGIGSNIAMCSCVITVIRDQFPRILAWQAALGVAVVGFSIGLVYVTPGGQYVLNLVDFFGTSFIVFILGIAELVTICWIYGVNRICRDVEFMIGIRPGIYWRICWGVITPILLIVILLYTFVTYKPVTYAGYVYPHSAIALGWTISAFGILQLPLWGIYTIMQQKGDSWSEKTAMAFKIKSNFGPLDPDTHEKYQKYMRNLAAEDAKLPKGNYFVRFKRHLFG